MAIETANKNQNNPERDNTEIAIQVLQRQLHRRFMIAILIASLTMALLWEITALYQDREARLAYSNTTTKNTWSSINHFQ